jgi:hypothetical protein
VSPGGALGGAPAIRVLEKLGFRREAHLVENAWIKGAWADSLIYAILAREWPARFRMIDSVALVNGAPAAGGAKDAHEVAVEAVADPAEIERHRQVSQSARRNSDWLQAHWAEVVPRARGRFLAVAGQEPFIADTPADAWAMAEAAHPEDQGVLVQFVRPLSGPRIYAHRR